MILTVWSPTPAPHEPPPYKTELFVIVRLPGEANLWCRETQIPHADSTRASAICDVPLTLLIPGANLIMDILQTSQQLLWYCDAVCTVVALQEHSKMCQSTQLMDQGDPKSVLDPKCSGLKHQKGGWKHRRQKSSAHWYNLDAIRGLQ